MHLRSVLASLTLLSITGVAAAEPLRLHGALGTGHALTGYQKSEYSWGAGAWAGLEYPFVKQLGLELSANWLGLGQGDPPTSQNVESTTGASAISPALGLQLTPFAASHNGKLFSPAGLWANVSGGVAFTNGLTRPMFDSRLDFDLLSESGGMGIGPMVAFVHVFQPNTEFRPDDANLLLFGVHA
ncbi:MAG TPA: hypothetical protein VNG33_01115, partial [Polyangiaceae bacterium]|nr:hypothetical protein [Polyangiaceae bacterium]